MAVALKTKYYGGFQSEFLDDDKTTAYNSQLN